MLDAEFRILDAGYWMLADGCCQPRAAENIKKPNEFACFPVALLRIRPIPGKQRFHWGFRKKRVRHVAPGRDGGGGCL